MKSSNHLVGITIERIVMKIEHMTAEMKIEKTSVPRYGLRLSHLIRVRKPERMWIVVMTLGWFRCWSCWRRIASACDRTTSAAMVKNKPVTRFNIAHWQCNQMQIPLPLPQEAVQSTLALEWLTYLFMFALPLLSARFPSFFTWHLVSARCCDISHRSSPDQTMKEVSLVGK